MSVDWAALFSCDRCTAEVTIVAVKGGGENLVAIGTCPVGHRKKIHLLYSKLREWVSVFNSHFFKCIKCDTPVTFKSVYKGSWVKVQIRCPAHGPNPTRLLPDAVHEVIKHAIKPASPISTLLKSLTEPASPESLSPGPPCQYCNNPTTFIPEYLRYYCYKCKRYKE